MYPQYAAATSASTYDVVFRHILRRRWVPTLRVAEPFYRHKRYLAALAESLNSALAQFSPASVPQKIVLSYHGIPEAYIERGDPYCCMCTEMTEALRPLIRFPADALIHTYQSRFGRAPWLVPYTDVTLRELAAGGIKRVLVACPGFTTDCLETIDELGTEGRRLFLECGGTDFTLVPCLNDSPGAIAAFRAILDLELGSWLADGEIKTPPVCRSCPVSEAKGAAA